MSEKKRTRIVNTFIFILLCVGAIVMIAPLLWMLSTSLKSKGDVFSLPPVWIPEELKWNEYVEIWQKGPLLSGFKNSLIVSFMVVIIGSITSSLAALALVKLRLPYKSKLYLLFLSAMMILFPSLLIPQCHM